MIVKGEHIRAAAGPVALVAVTGFAITTALGIQAGIENLNVKPSSSTSASVAGHGILTKTEFQDVDCDPVYKNVMTEGMKTRTTGYQYVLNKQISYPVGGADVKYSSGYITRMCQMAGQVITTVNEDIPLHDQSMTEEELEKLPDNQFRLVIKLPGAYYVETRRDVSKKPDVAYEPTAVEKVMTAGEALGGLAKDAVDKVMNNDTKSTKKNAPYVDNIVDALVFLEDKGAADSAQVCAKALIANPAWVEQRKQSTAKKTADEYNKYTGANAKPNDVRVIVPAGMTIVSEYPDSYVDTSVTFGGSVDQPQGLYEAKTTNSQTTCDIAPGAIDPSKKSGTGSSAPSPSAATTTPGGR